jgi:phosphonate transport system permease protein
MSKTEHTLPFIRLTKEKQWYTWLAIASVLVLTLFTATTSQFNIWELFLATPGILDFIFSDFFPPAIEALPSIWEPLLDTVFMSIVATISGALLSLLLALACARPTCRWRTVQLTTRALVSLLRNIPSIAWALILVPAFGIGKFVGVFALLISSIGSMTRFFAESIEEINLEGIEALRATGASYWQVIKHAVLPQCMPQLISWTLYNLELNIRASAIIGMVGGGGIGMYIQSTIKLFRYDYAAMAILLVAVSVILLEYGSNKIREKIQ